MIHIDLEKLNIPQEILDELEAATAHLISLETEEEREAYILKDKSQKLWRKVRPYLAKIVGKNENDAKCWYCEGKSHVFTPHVDHFRPKTSVRNKGKQREAGYWWLAFRITNYRLACQFCNSGSGKNDQFPLEDGCKRAVCETDNIENEVVLLLDPVRYADRNWLTFSDDGRIHPLRPPTTFIGRKAQTSIDVYDLNHDSKVEARKQVRLECMELIRRAQRALEILDNQGYQQNEASLLSSTERFEDVFHDIEAKVSEDAEFSAAARFFFRGSGEEWLSNI